MAGPAIQEYLFTEPQLAQLDPFKRGTADSARDESKNPLMPGANSRSALALEVLEWHRGKEFQVVSLCQIMRQLLYLANPEKYATGPQLQRTSSFKVLRQMVGLRRQHDNRGVPTLGIVGTAMAEPDVLVPKSGLRSFCSGINALTHGGSGERVRNGKVDGKADVYISLHCASAARLVRQLQEGACEHLAMTQGDFRDAVVFVVYLQRESCGRAHRMRTTSGP
jgi:hypothetical protein